MDAGRQRPGGRRDTMCNNPLGYWATAGLLPADRRAATPKVTPNKRSKIDMFARQFRFWAQRDEFLRSVGTCVVSQSFFVGR